MRMLPRTNSHKHSNTGPTRSCLFILLTARRLLVKKRKNKNKNRSKSRPCSERHARLTGHQALARALGPRAEGLTSGGRTGPGRGVRSLSGGHRVLSAHGFCGLETRTQPRPDSEERHFPSTTPGGGGGWVLARKVSPSTPTPLGRLQVV